MVFVEKTTEHITDKIRRDQVATGRVQTRFHKRPVNFKCYPFDPIGFCVYVKTSDRLDR